MGAQVLWNVQLLVGAYDVSAFSGMFDFDASAEMKDCPNFSSLGYNVVTPGLTTSHGMVGGYSDYSTSAINQSFRAAQNGSPQAFSVIPTGTAAVAGDSALTMSGALSQFKPLTGNTGDVAGFTLELAGNSAGVDGFVGVPLGARSSLTGTAVQMGAVTATERLWAALHVTAAVGTNLSVTITSDNAVGFPSPATQLTFATTSTIGWQFLSVAGPITDDWFKVTHSSTGSFTYAVVMGVM